MHEPRLKYVNVYYISIQLATISTFCLEAYFAIEGKEFGYKVNGWSGNF